MALAGELARADELREQFGLCPDVLSIDVAEANAQRAAAAEAYLGLSLPASSVLFVNNDTTISRYPPHVMITITGFCWLPLSRLPPAFVKATN